MTTNIIAQNCDNSSSRTAHDDQFYDSFFLECSSQPDNGQHGGYVPLLEEPAGYQEAYDATRDALSDDYGQHGIGYQYGIGCQATPTQAPVVIDAVARQVTSQVTSQATSQVTPALTYEYTDYVGPEIVKFMDEQEGTRFIIDPDTGHGKTTAMEMAAKRVLLAMPNQSQCLQRQEKGSFAIIEGVSTRDIPLDADNVATTYNSLPRATAAYKPDMLAIDEIHHFLTDGYRQGAIKDAYRVIMGFNGQVALMSATPLADIMQATIFKGFQAIACSDIGTERPDRDIPILAIEGGAIDYALEIERSGMVNGRHFPYDGVIQIHMNDKKAIQAGIAHINSFNMPGRAYGFTADTKEATHHKNMIKDGQTPDDCRFLFTTSIMNDGLSIGPRANVALISRESTLYPHEIVQFTARWREGLDMTLPDALIIFKREAKNKSMDLGHEGPMFEKAVIARYNAELEEAERDLSWAMSQREGQKARIEACKGTAEAARIHKTIEAMNASQTNLIFRQDTIEIDRIALIQRAFAACGHMTTGQLIREVVEFGGFHYANEAVCTDIETKEVSQATIKLKAEEKEAKAQQFQNAVAVARDQGIEWVRETLDTVKVYPDMYPDGTVEGLATVASLWRVCEKEEGDFDKVLNVIEEREITSKKKADKLSNRIRMASIVESGQALGDMASDGHASAKGFVALSELLPRRTTLSKAKIKEIKGVMATIEGSSLIGKWTTDKQIEKSIRSLFECSRTSKREKGKKSALWQVNGTFDLSDIRKGAIAETVAKPVKAKAPTMQQASLFDRQSAQIK